jgi:hypothetical protein
MLDTGTATLHIVAIGADYFLIQDSPGYQGMLDTGTAALNLTWEGRLHNWLMLPLLLSAKCPMVDYLLIQDAPGYQHA